MVKEKQGKLADLIPNPARVAHNESKGGYVVRRRKETQCDARMHDLARFYSRESNFTQM